MFKKVFLYVSFILFGINSFAQQTAKKQFAIYKNGVEVNNPLYEKGINSIILDEYRCISERTNIFVKTSDTEPLLRVELFSAKELETLYGKSISPLCKKELPKKRPLFMLLPEGKLKIMGYK